MGIRFLSLMFLPFFSFGSVRGSIDLWGNWIMIEPPCSDGCSTIAFCFYNYSAFYPSKLSYYDFNYGILFCLNRNF